MNEAPKITIEQAMAALEADRQQRVEECKKAVDAALSQYRCKLSAHILVDDKPIPVSVQLVAQ